MGRCGIGCALGWAVALGAGFVAVDHFVLKDKFGIWLKLSSMLQGVAPATTTTTSSDSSDSSSSSGSSNPDLGTGDEYDVAGVKAASPSKAAAQRKQHLANLNAINVPAAGSTRTAKSPAPLRIGGCGPACQRCLKSKMLSVQACNQIKG